MERGEGILKMIIYTKRQSNRIPEIVKDIREIRTFDKFLWIVIAYYFASSLSDELRKFGFKFPTNCDQKIEIDSEGWGKKECSNYENDNLHEAKVTGFQKLREIFVFLSNFFLKLKSKRLLYIIFTNKFTLRFKHCSRIEFR